MNPLYEVMRALWKGNFLFKNNEYFYSNSIIVITPHNKFSIHPVYTGKKWDIVKFEHPLMRGFKLKNFVISKLIGNIHGIKRKVRNKLNKRKKNG
jgi:hypothetical protein